MAEIEVCPIVDLLVDDPSRPGLDHTILDSERCFICGDASGLAPGGHDGRPCPSGLTRDEAREIRINRGEGSRALDW